MQTKRITRIALFTAVALLLNLLESLLPPFLPYAPGAKIGLSNLVTLVALVLLGYTDAYLILTLRCLLGGIFGGNLAALMYSVPAGVLSLTVQILLFHFAFRFVSIAGIGFLGAVVHNATQVAVASVMVRTNLAAMLPFMLAASVAAGLAVGLAAFYLIKFLPRRLFAPYASASREQTT